MPYATKEDRQAYRKRWLRSDKGKAARASQKRRWRARKLDEQRAAVNPQPLASAIQNWRTQ